MTDSNSKVFNCRLLIAFLLGSLLYLAKIPYLIRSWRSSPLDRPDAAFLLLALVLMALTLLKTLKRDLVIRPYLRVLGVLAATVGAAVFSYGLAIGVNLVQFCGAFGFWLGAFAAMGGFDATIRMVPAFGLLALAVPSTSYLLGNFLGLSSGTVLILKACAALSFTVLSWRVMSANAVERLVPRRFLVGAFAFGLVLGGAFAARHYLESGGVLTGEPFHPDFAVERCGDYLGRQIEPDERFKRFFNASDARQYVFASHEATVQALAVKLGSDVHEIHPATHCLRTTGWYVWEEQAREERLGDRLVAIDEALVAQGDEKWLSWMWYADDSESTASFVRFRSQAARGGWRIYQLRASATPTLDAARETLRGFLQTLTAASGKEENEL